jgi:hypothetical protein
VPQAYAKGRETFVVEGWNFAGDREHISKVEISRPTPSGEKQVIVVFIPNLHCFVHSKFFGFSSSCIHFHIYPPQNQA